MKLVFAFLCLWSAIMTFGNMLNQLNWQIWGVGTLILLGLYLISCQLDILIKTLKKS